MHPVAMTQKLFESIQIPRKNVLFCFVFSYRCIWVVMQHKYLHLDQPLSLTHTLTHNGLNKGFIFWQLLSKGRKMKHDQGKKGCVIVCFSSCQQQYLIFGALQEHEQMCACILRVSTLITMHSLSLTPGKRQEVKVCKKLNIYAATDANDNSQSVAIKYVI